MASHNLVRTDSYTRLRSVMEQVIFEDETTLPLFIKPKNGKDSAEFLIQWIGDNKELVKQKILEYGACNRATVQFGNALLCRCSNV